MSYVLLVYPVILLAYLFSRSTSSFFDRQTLGTEAWRGRGGSDRAPPGAGAMPGVDRTSRLGMMIGMTSCKIAVSLPRRTVERARRAVAGGRAPSMSAYVAAALDEKVKLDGLGELLDEMLAQSGGPLTPAERRAADRALDARRPRGGKR